MLIFKFSRKVQVFIYLFTFLKLLYSYTYTYTCRNIFNTIKTSGHSSLEKYTSHFIRKFERVTKGFTVGEVSWRPNRTYWLPLFWLSQPFFLVLLDCSTEGLGAQPLLGHSSPQLTWTSCHRGYIIIWLSPTFCERHNFALNSTPQQLWLPLISWYLRLDAIVIYTGAFLLLTAWSGRRSICNKVLVCGLMQHWSPLIDVWFFLTNYSRSCLLIFIV